MNRIAALHARAWSQASVASSANSTASAYGIALAHATASTRKGWSAQSECGHDARRGDRVGDGL